MGSRQRSRRGVLKAGAAFASVGLVGSLSGCSSLLESDSDTADETDTGASGAAADIPARSNVAMSMSFDAVLNDQAIRGAVNSALSEQSTESSMLPSSVSEALQRTEQQSGVDPRNLNDLVLFGESSGDESGEYMGWLLYTDWSQSELTSLVEQYDDDGVATEEYSGTTVYTNGGMDDDTERMAVLSDGTVVLGRNGSATDVIDLRNGDAEAISGDLLSAWNAASGDYATLAMDISPEDLPDGRAEAAAPTVRDIEYAYGSVYADGDKRGTRFNLEASSEQDAADLKTFLDGQMALETEKAEDERMKQALNETAVTTEGTTVVMTNEVDVDTITPVIEQVITLFVAQAGQAPPIGVDGSSVSI